MNVAKRIICAVLVFAMLACALTSCGKAPEDVIALAEKSLANGKYAVDIKITYESDNESMQSAIAASAASSFDMRVIDEEHFKIGMTYVNGDTVQRVVYTRLGGQLYLQFKSDDVDICEEVEYNDQFKEDIKDRLGSAVTVNAYDFEKLKTSGRKGSTVVTCTEMKEETLEKLTESLQAEFYELSAHVAIKDVKLTVNISDGRYDTAVFECKYVISTLDEVYNIYMTLESDFDYRDEMIIVNPSNP